MYWISFLPRLAVFLPLAALLTSWLTVIFSDFLNYQLKLLPPNIEMSNYPLLWFYLFREAGSIEQLQWTCQSLALICTVSAFLIVHKNRFPVERQVFFFLSAGLLMMLAEDALNVRHVISHYYLIPLFDSHVTPRKVQMVWETTFYIFLSSLMVGALWKILRTQGSHLFAPNRLLIAYAVYGLVGFGSSLRWLGSWQERFGHWIIDVTNVMGLPAWQIAYSSYLKATEINPNHDATLGHMLTDRLIEESIELIAASLLLSGIILMTHRFLVKRDVSS